MFAEQWGCLETERHNSALTFAERSPYADGVTVLFQCALMFAEQCNPEQRLQG